MTVPRAVAVAIEPMRREQWPAVARIYGERSASGDATFETSVPSWERWDASHLREHRFVALDEKRGCRLGGACTRFRRLRQNGENRAVRLVVAGLLLLLATACGAITAVWAYGKAFGTEFDLCPDGGTCYSGWYGVAAFAALTFVLALAALRVWRRRSG